MKEANIFLLKKSTNSEAKLASSRLGNSRFLRICEYTPPPPALGKEIKTTIHRMCLSSQLYLRDSFFFFLFQPQNGFLSYTGFFPAIALSPLKGLLIRCTAVRRLSSTLILWGHLSLLSLTASQPGLLFVKWTLLSYLGSFVFPTALEIFIVGKYLTFFTSESSLPLHSKVCLVDCACRVDVRKKSLQE